MSIFTTLNCCSPQAGSTSCPHGWVDVLAVIDTAPETPDPDRYYLVGSSPSGVLAGHDNEYAWFVGGGWNFCSPAAGDKVSVDGACGWSCWNGSSWQVQQLLNNTYSGFNLGGSSDGMIFKQVTSGGQFQYRKIVGVGQASVATVGDEVRITVNVPPSGGEVNLGANVGASGAGVYRNKTSTTLNFRKLYNDDGSVSVTEQADQIRIRANIPTPPTYAVDNIGDPGGEVFDSVNSGTFYLRRLRPISEDVAVFDIQNNAPDKNIDFVFAPSLGLLSLWGDALRLYDVAVTDGQVMAWDTDSWIGADIDLDTLGTGQGTIYAGSPGTLQFRFKSIRQGSNVIITEDANEITINAAAGGVFTGANLGTGSDGEGWYSSTVDTEHRFKRIKAGTDIFLTPDTNFISVASRSATAGAGITITPGATDNTFAVTDYATLLADATTGDASIIKSGPPWLLRKLQAGSGIAITENPNKILFTHALLFSSLGGGLDFVDGWNAATLEAPTAVAGAGMDIQRVGDTLVFSVTSGGGSGGGVSGTALVGGYANSTVSTGLDRWGLTATTVKFPTTTLSVATITKNGANEEFTINKIGKWKIAAKATINTGYSHTQHQMWAEVDTGGGWAEVAGSRSYAYTTNELQDLQTIHTGEFSINITNLVSKVRFRVITNGGPVRPFLLDGGTSVTFEEAVGPVWEVITESTTARTLSSTDNGKIIVCTNAGTTTITCDEDLLASFQCDVIRNNGAVEIRLGGAATLNSVVGTTPDLSAQYGRARIVAISGTGANDAVFNVSGDIV